MVTWFYSIVMSGSGIIAHIRGIVSFPGINDYRIRLMISQSLISGYSPRRGGSIEPLI
jgi:hypothetical protein